MKKFKPVILKASYFDKIEKEINKLLYDNVYAEIFKELKKPLEVLNDDSYISNALLRGKLYYVNGVFKGAINSTVSKELKSLGAIYNKKSGGWTLSEALIPANIKSALVIQEDYISSMGRNIVKHLDAVANNPDIDTTMINETYGVIVDDMNSAILKTITIDSELTPDATKIIADEYTKNLRLYINKWNSDNIVKLREAVLANTQKGGRMESLVDMVRQNYGVSQRKAKFLARQETSLLMSKMRETRYKDAGIAKYIWSTSGKNNVRDDHKKLDGTIQSWDNPPIVDSRTGRKAHAGEDFNCNCVAIPIVE